MNLLFGSLFVAFGWAIASILQKYLLRSLEPTFFLLWIFGFAFLVVGLLYLSSPTPIDIPRFSLRTYGLVALTALVGFVGPYMVLLHLIKHYNVSKVIALAYVTPLITLFLSRLFLQEHISKTGALGVVLIVSGAFLVNTKSE